MSDLSFCALCNGSIPNKYVGKFRNPEGQIICGLCFARLIDHDYPESKLPQLISLLHVVANIALIVMVIGAILCFSGTHSAGEALVAVVLGLSSIIILLCIHCMVEILRNLIKIVDLLEGRKRRC